MAKAKRRRRRKGGSSQGKPRGTAGRGLTPEERELEQLLAVAEERAREAHDPATRPERIAQILAEDFAGMPAPVGFAATLVDEGSHRRARAVEAELIRRAPGSVTALTFEAELIRVTDGDPSRAQELLEQALDADLEPGGEVPLAEHMLAGGRTLDALHLVEEAMVEDPEDEAAQAALAEVLGRIHQRELAGEPLTREERAALRRFSDRTLLYELREELVAYVDERPELQLILAEEARDWQEPLPEGASVMDPEYEGLFRLAVEHAWLLGDADEPDDELEEEDSSPLGRFARDPATSRQLAIAARNWQETVTYGLWQLADPTPAPGVWLTDLISATRRYVSIPPEQIEQAARWTVLVGAVVAVDGIWRTTGTVIPLRPAEGDAAAEMARDATIDFVEEISGERVPRRRRPKRAGEPHGVLVGQLEAVPAPVAYLMSQVMGNLLPEIVAAVLRHRAAGIGVTNMEGHRVRMITAELKVPGAAAAAKQLAEHPDFRSEEEGELTWWGRELTAGERHQTLAQVRAQWGEEAALEVERSDERPRWLRGRVRPRPHGFEVEVNSEERLALLLELLGELGLHAEVERRSVIDPSEDLPRIPAGSILGFGSSQEAVETWLSTWPEERVPALGGVTPRAAARNPKRRARLEAVLREFEYDTDLLRRQDRPAPDIDRLRRELGMEGYARDR